MPRGTLGARGHVTQPRPNFRLFDNFFFFDLRGVFVLVYAYQLRLRSPLGIEARRINCLEATTIALYPSPPQFPDLHPQPSIDHQLQLRLRQPPTQFEFIDRVMARQCQFFSIGVAVPDLPPPSVER
jgi:hypothetical protein